VIKVSIFREQVGGGGAGEGEQRGEVLRGPTSDKIA